MEIIKNELSEIAKLPKELMAACQQFQQQLQKRPPQTSVLTYDFAGEKFQYLPISYLEKSLNKYFFGMWQWEITESKIVVNEFVVTGNLKVLHPVTGVWLTYSGIGSSPIQQDKGSSVSEFINTKKVKALTMGAPKANIEAFKNACKRIGKLFGQDLNRKFEEDYTPFNIKPLNE
jgi:hypothetical protein